MEFSPTYFPLQKYKLANHQQPAATLLSKQKNESKRNENGEITNAGAPQNA